MEPRIQYAKTEDGVSIAYATEGEGQPLVTVSPQAISHVQRESAMFPNIFPPLARAFRLIRYDPRGAGLSERDAIDFSMEAMMRDLDAVVERLGLQSFAVLAFRGAVPVAVTYAATFPDRVSHLVLVDGWTNWSDVAGMPVWETLDALIDKDWTMCTETLARVLIGMDDPQVIGSLGEYIRACMEPEAFRAFFAALRSWDVADLLPKVGAQTLVLHNNDARVAPIRAGQKLAAGIPDARFLAIDDMNLERVPALVENFAGTAGKAQPATGGQTQISSPPETKTFASGRYVVVRLLGQGTQKSVYLVDDTVLGRQCALSMLNAALLDPSDVDRIKREAQTMAQFGTQPNIVTVYDYGEQDGAPFIVCEYVPGGELRDELAAAAGPMPLERTLAVAIDICRALSFAHGRDIVHRDIKPENVWLTAERNAKLGDFGIALSLGRTRLTAPGGQTGTPAYMAPEQASGGDVDARSDLYAFGALLYELVAGRPPFVGDDPNAIMYQHINAEPESPLEHNASLPPSLERLIMRLLAKPKADRPDSAEEVLAELEHAAR